VSLSGLRIVMIPPEKEDRQECLSRC